MLLEKEYETRTLFLIGKKTLRLQICVTSLISELITPGRHCYIQNLMFYKDMLKSEKYSDCIHR